MPWTVRVGLGLSALLLLVILAVEPASRYFWLLSDVTIPELRKPESARLLNEGLTNRQWTERFLPGDLQPNGLGVVTGLRRARLELGLRWLYLTGLFSSAIMVFILALVSYFLARPFARKLASPPLSLLFALISMVLFYRLDSATHLSLPQNPAGLETLPVQSGQLIAQVWAAPLCLVTAALLASFIPFRRVDPPPGQFVRFVTLFRDAGFLGLALLLLYFIAYCFTLQSADRRANPVDIVQMEKPRPLPEPQKGSFIERV